jgi:hypothetical protein
MRAGTVTLLSLHLLAAGALPCAPAEARGAGKAHHRRGPAASDTDRTLARMAERDRLRWGLWEHPRPLPSYLPPLTRERVAAPPLTGWGYGGTVPGALPGF